MKKEFIKEILKKMAIIVGVLIVLDVGYMVIQMIFESEPEVVDTDNTNQQEIARIDDDILQETANKFTSYLSILRAI